MYDGWFCLFLSSLNIPICLVSVKSRPGVRNARWEGEWGPMVAVYIIKISSLCNKERQQVGLDYSPILRNNFKLLYSLTHMSRDHPEVSRAPCVI